MNRRGTGICFMGISACLFIGRYVTAAIFMSGTESQSAEIFRAGLRYVGSTLSVLSTAALVLGAAYIILAEVTDWMTRKGTKENKR